MMEILNTLLHGSGKNLPLSGVKSQQARVSSYIHSRQAFNQFSHSRLTAGTYCSLFSLRGAVRPCMIFPQTGARRNESICSHKVGTIMPCIGAWTVSIFCMFALIWMMLKTQSCGDYVSVTVMIARSSSEKV